MNFFKKRAQLPPGVEFIEDFDLTKILQPGPDPILLLELEIDGEKVQYAIHQGLAWQLVRKIRKAIGFSESELEAGAHYMRWGGGGV